MIDTPKRLIIAVLVCLISFFLLKKHFTDPTWLPDKFGLLEPGLEITDCWFYNKFDRPTKCAYLYVHENPEDNKSRILRLAVVIFKSDSYHPKSDPVLYLQGGPGQAYIGNDYIGWTFENIVSQDWLRDRDIIIVDYRGLGLSNPRLVCDDLGHELLLATSPSDWDEIFTICHDELKAKVGDPSQYHALNIVRDLISLRKHLAIERWNLWGQSYGSMIAMLMADEDNEAVRSVVTEGVFPPRYRSDYLSNVKTYLSLLNGVFENCEKTPNCNRSYPDSRKQFVQLLNKLNVNPFTIKVNLYNRNYDVQINDRWFADVLINLFYSSTDREHVVEMVRATHEGNFDFFTKEFLDYFNELSMPLFSFAGYMQFVCNETETLTKELLKSSNYPRWVVNWLQPSYFCNHSGYYSRTNVLKNEKVSFDTPILFISGLLDHVTPAKWTKDILDDFPNGQRIVFPNAAHSFIDASVRKCSSLLKRQFIKNPFGKIKNGTCPEKGIAMINN